jgi:small-conductance mechanosensitive channel
MITEPVIQMAGPLSQQRLDDILWVWIFPVLGALVAALLALTAGRTLLPLRPDDPLTPLDESKGQGWRRFLRAALQGLVFLALVSATEELDRRLHGEARGLRVLGLSAGVLGGWWAGFLLLDSLARSLSHSLHGMGRASASAVVPLLRKILKAVWGCLLLLIYLDNLGMNVSALLAGLGVGGLAVALAGQKTMENLFGGMVLVLDQPVRVGDFCKFGDKQGTVEEVGLRSIKIRTPERTLISVPNGEFSQLQIENVALRDRICFTCTLRLRYDSPAPQLREALARTESCLKAEPKVDPTQPNRCRLTNVGAYSLDLDVFCYLATTDWDEFMVLRQDLMLKLLEAVQATGCQLAYPTQTALQEAPSHGR